MDWRGWVKTVAVAAGGGAVTGGLAALLDPRYFNIHDWIDEQHVAIMALEGAGIALGGLLLRSPVGRKAVDFMHHAQEQAEKDRQELEKLKSEWKQK